MLKKTILKRQGQIVSWGGRPSIDGVTDSAFAGGQYQSGKMYSTLELYVESWGPLNHCNNSSVVVEC